MPGDEQLEAVDEAAGRPASALGQRRQLGREVDDEGRLDERRLDEGLEHVLPDLVGRCRRAPAPGARVERRAGPPPPAPPPGPAPGRAARADRARWPRPPPSRNAEPPPGRRRGRSCSPW